jgi:methyl-accepting chemotaxis protein
MKIGTKVIVCAAGGVLLATLGAVLTVYSISHTNRVNELKGLMSAAIQQAETVMNNVDQLHQRGAFNVERLTSNLKEQGVENYRASVLYQTVPVVSGWESVQVVAKANGFEFFTLTRPDLHARNPKNQQPEFDDAFLAFAGGKSEYFVEDSKSSRLILARPVRLRGTCLQCHGDPSSSPAHNGRDVLGFAMDGMREGDIKGAFVLKAPMKHDAVVFASMEKISLVGLTVLAVIILVFYFLNRRLIVQPLQAVAEELSRGSAHIRQASDQLADSSQSLAQGATEQAASIEETSATTEEINSMTQKNAEHSKAVAGLMAEATGSVREANHKLEQMVASMQEITGSSDRISKIIKVIDEIAFQTNILALNAAVEAARAGEAGMGFAVVANEVRSLAQRSAQAAKDTTSLIEESIATSREGSGRLGEVTNAIHRVTELSEKVKVFIDEVSAGSHEQAKGIEQITAAIRQMDEVTQRSAASAEESASAGRELRQESESLDGIISRLTVLVDGR